MMRTAHGTAIGGSDDRAYRLVMHDGGGAAADGDAAADGASVQVLAPHELPEAVARAHARLLQSSSSVSSTSTPAGSLAGGRVLKITARGLTDIASTAVNFQVGGCGFTPGGPVAGTVLFVSSDGTTLYVVEPSVLDPAVSLCSANPGWSRAIMNEWRGYAPVAVWTEDLEFADLMRRLACAAADEIPAAPPDPATIPSPP